jgi:hypothetical protein
MTDLDSLDLRQLQLESARAVSTMQATNNNLARFNKSANHDSQIWYKEIIKWYIDTHGGLPSEVGPGSTIKLLDVQV